MKDGKGNYDPSRQDEANPGVKDWTEEDIRKFLILNEQKCPKDIIAVTMNRTRVSITHKINLVRYVSKLLILYGHPVTRENIMPFMWDDEVSIKERTIFRDNREFILHRLQPGNN
jgi:hypothetical protein